MSKTLSIEEVELAFSSWRVNRQHVEPIPSDLLEQVKILLQHYKPHMLGKRLKLSGSQMKKLSARSNLSKKNKDHSSLSSQDFIPAVFPSSCESSVEVIISGSNQKTMVLKLNTLCLQMLLPTLMETL